ncbi:MAG: hypothetical protein ACOCV8_05870 [Spirochaetota bacterium]
MKNKLPFLIISILLISLFILSCVTSEEIIISYPEEADWHFEYYDAIGEYIGEGKAVMEYDSDTNQFIFTIKESVFGDEAVINGQIMNEEITEDTDLLSFNGTGNWFMQDNFAFTGTFELSENSPTKIYDGSAAYSQDIKNEISDLLKELKTYREEIIKYENLQQEGKNIKEVPEKPKAEKYMSKLFTFKAYIIKEKNDKN